MQYNISYNNPLQHFVDIELIIDHINQPIITLKLPAWRPGRYELGNFIGNIQKFQVTDAQNNSLPFRKTEKDHWEVETSGIDCIKVQYNYYAYKMDAGSCWLDEHQLYLNFINCLIFTPDRLHEDCILNLEIPDDYIIACGLDKTATKQLSATSFYHLVECPLIASNQLQHFSYELDQTKYHLWLMGQCDLNWKKVEADFIAFTSEQTLTMGAFPSSDYHFLCQILPFRMYHGVEHYNSTVIALGPGESMNEDWFYQNFMGVCSHELFHTWNVIRIKPEEFIPYDFTRENYFETGFVAEGFTTYYGDLFLVRSGVFDKNWYFTELKKLLNRHLHNFGRFNLSLAQSSFDLWIDGYKKGTPDRKVSIYTKGALVALMLDLKIRQCSQNKNSLDQLMLQLWQKFGDTRSGYTTADIVDMASELAGTSLQDFLEDLVEGVTPIERYLSELLTFVGCELTSETPDNLYENHFGFKATKKETHHIITQLHPDSAAAGTLSLDDEIIAVNGRKASLDLNLLIGKEQKVTLTVFRQNRLLEVILHRQEEAYFPDYGIRQIADTTDEQQRNFKAWLKCQ